MALEVPSCACLARIGSGQVPGRGIRGGVCAAHRGYCGQFPRGHPRPPAPGHLLGGRPHGCWARSPLLKGFGGERDGEKEEEGKK